MGAVLAKKRKPETAARTYSNNSNQGGDMTQAGQNGVQMVPIAGGFQVYTRRVGHGPIKLLLLHGGPGCTHEYFECFEQHLSPHEYTFYYYDQLGSLFSDQPDDVSLWTIPRFVEEVEQVRLALGLDDFYLLGQSWGGLLGTEYALEHQAHLKGLIVSNMTASIPDYVRYINLLREQMPPETVAAMKRFEAAGDLDNPDYQAPLMELYRQHICRLDPWPDAVERTFAHMGLPVYHTMQGANEFVVTGTFRDWDRWADLPRITVPTLLSVGRYDSMDPASVTEMGRRLPQARVSICEQGSHLSMWDDAESYFADLKRFLADVETGSFQAGAATSSH
jgi:proline iminopeptidase